MLEYGFAAEEQLPSCYGHGEAVVVAYLECTKLAVKYAEPQLGA